MKNKEKYQTLLIFLFLIFGLISILISKKTIMDHNIWLTTLLDVMSIILLLRAGVLIGKINMQDLIHRDIRDRVTWVIIQRVKNYNFKYEPDSKERFDGESLISTIDKEIDEYLDI